MVKGKHMEIIVVIIFISFMVGVFDSEVKWNPNDKRPDTRYGIYKGKRYTHKKMTLKEFGAVVVFFLVWFFFCLAL